MNREKLTDEELIIAIRNGDNIATNVLLERYKTTVKKISHKLFLTNGNIEDLVQEGMIGVFDAINSYRSDNKDATFKTYAYTCIQRRIFSAIRSSKTNKNKPLEYYISLSVDNSNENDRKIAANSTILDPETELIAQEAYDELSNKLHELLSKKEEQVLLLYLEGYTYGEISEKLKISVKSVDNAIQRVKKKIEQLKK